MGAKNKCQSKSILPSDQWPSPLDRRILQMSGDRYADAGDVVLASKAE
jgi:hypothetical protein